jgi:hypothetical protein
MAFLRSTCLDPTAPTSDFLTGTKLTSAWNIGTQSLLSPLCRHNLMIDPLLHSVIHMSRFIRLAGHRKEIAGQSNPKISWALF